MVLEDDEAIFKSILQSLILKPLIEVFKKQHMNTRGATVKFEKEVEFPGPDFKQKNQFYT